MSLSTDKFFFKALSSSEEITEAVDGRIFNPARSTVDENEDKVPYIILTFDGLTNEQGTKDDVEGETDTVQVGILCVADDRESLATLTEAVRTQCREYLKSVLDTPGSEDADIAPSGWTFSADAVQYDDMKPCVFQTLRYACDTYR